MPVQRQMEGFPCLGPSVGQSPCEEGTLRRLACAQVSLGNYDKEQYCSSVRTGALTPVAHEGNYAHFSVPISAFKCPFGAGDISQVGFQNSPDQAVAFCLDQVAITSGGSVSAGRRLKQQ